MKRKIIVFSKHSFISYVEHLPVQSRLVATMRSGKVYHIDEFSASDFYQIEVAPNKGGYMAQNVLSGPNRKTARYAGMATPAEMKEIERKYKPFTHKFLAR